MNTEAIIEELLSSENEQIRNVPLDELNLPIRVYRTLWRANVRTIGGLADAWSEIMTIRHFGEGAREDTLDALQAWFLCMPEIPEPNPAEDQTLVPDPNPILNLEAHAQPPLDDLYLQLPIEALHLSQRTYRALRRNHIETIDDIRQEFDRIRTFRNVGPRALDEIRRALEEMR